MTWKLGTALLLLGLMAPSVPAHAQAFGHYTGAEVVPMGGHLFGGYVQASEGLLGLSSQLRLSFYPNIDFGFQGGLTRTDYGAGDVMTVQLGTDIKFQITKGRSVSLALGGALGVETGDNVHLLSVGPTFTASHVFGNPAGAGISPYAGVALLYTDADLLDQQSQDVTMPFRLGADFRLAPEIRIMSEIQLRANDPYSDSFAFITGVNLPF